jgi:hypothetical protein
MCALGLPEWQPSGVKCIIVKFVQLHSPPSTGLGLGVGAFSQSA